MATPDWDGLPATGRVPARRSPAARPRSGLRSGGLVILLCAFMATPSALSELHAQVPPSPDFGNTSYAGIGYVANAPDALLGGGGFVLLRGGFGAYLDFKTSHDSPGRDDFFNPDLTPEMAEDLGDRNIRQKNAYRSFNAALVRRVMADMAVYLGAGITRREEYHEFEDPAGERGFFGFYWTEDREATGDRLNVLGGVMFHAGRHLIFQFGLESEPTGVTVGLNVGLPF